MKEKMPNIASSVFCCGIVVLLAFIAIRSEIDMRSRAKENREYHAKVVSELQMLRSRPDLSPEDIKRISDINFRFEEDQARFNMDLEEELIESKFTK